MWRKAMDYLGLGPDDAYDDYDDYDQPRGRRDRDPRDRDPRDRDPRERDHRDRDPRDRDPRDRDRDRDPRDRDPRERRDPRDRGGYDDYDEAPSRSASRPSFPQRDGDVVVRRPAPAPDDSSVQPRPVNGGRAAPGRGGKSVEPHSVKPRRFDSAQEVADHFRDGIPVIMNLEGCDKETSRRLIDFASGLCYGLSGNMEKVATGVYLLKPYGTRHDD